MECKTVKQPVCVNQTVFFQKGEIPFDLDFSLPDYCPDIRKILKCRVTPGIFSKAATGQSITVDGQISACVFYCDEQNGVYSYEQTVPFNKTFQGEENLDGALVEICTKLQYVNCRAVSERKIDIHGAVAISVGANCLKTFEILSDADRPDFQFERAEMPTLNAISNAEKNLLVEERLDISSSLPTVGCILKSSAEISVDEVKPIRSKVNVKGNLSVEVLYCDEQHRRYQNYSTVIPYSQFIDMPEVREDCRCECRAQICFLEVKPIKGSEECRSLSMNAKVFMQVSAYCDRNVPVILDLYSTRYEIDAKREELPMDRICSSLKDRYTYQGVMDFPLKDLAGILDFSRESETVGCRFENGKVLVSLRLNVGFLYCNSDSQISYAEKSEEFTYEHPVEDSIGENAVCNPDFRIASVSYNILSESQVEFRVEYTVGLCIHEVKNIRAVARWEEDSQKVKGTPDCSLVAYFAAKGEKIWDIAKRYNSNLAEMQALNGLKETEVPEQRCLLIPVR